MSTGNWLLILGSISLLYWFLGFHAGRKYEKRQRGK